MDDVLYNSQVNIPKSELSWQSYCIDTSQAKLADNWSYPEYYSLILNISICQNNTASSKPCKPTSVIQKAFIDTQIQFYMTLPRTYVDLADMTKKPPIKTFPDYSLMFNFIDLFYTTVSY